MRPLVSYDDISPQAADVPSTSASSSNQPPYKKRKRSDQGQKPRREPRHVQHWDDPVSLEEHMDYDEGTTVGVDGAEEEGDEESRELTYEEIWDDSALIDAWNAASEEYEAFHGPDKDWKKAPVNKSPLWYHVPAPPKKKPKVQASAAKTHNTTPPPVAVVKNGDEADSQPLNFDTFVPTHDPSLDLPVPSHPPAVPGPDYASYYLPQPPGPLPSADEAFSRALGAMYWGGYWTAVYHCHRNSVQHSPAEEDLEVLNESYEVQEEEVQDEGNGGDFLPTQR